MLFTADGLEQATRLEVAAQHAQRFRAAGVRHVLDLGCGIGADAMAFAGLDLQVTGHRRRRGDRRDRRGQPAALAGRDPVTGRAEDVRLPSGRGRPARRRVARPGAPDTRAWPTPAGGPGGSSASTRSRRRGTTVQRFARDLPATGAKLSPSFPHAAVPPGAEAQWTS